MDHYLSPEERFEKIKAYWEKNYIYETPEDLRWLIRYCEQLMESREDEMELERKAVLKALQRYLDWPDLKAKDWYQKKNPIFDYKSPEYLVSRGQGFIVWQFVVGAVEIANKDGV